jgi:hypothetical protein
MRKNLKCSNCGKMDYVLFGPNEDRCARCSVFARKDKKPKAK